MKSITMDVDGLAILYLVQRGGDWAGRRGRPNPLLAVPNNTIQYRNVTDRRTDRIAVSVSSVSVLTGDDNNGKSGD